jgi:hypothetical protein
LQVTKIRVMMLPCSVLSAQRSPITIMMGVNMSYQRNIIQ